MLLSVLFTDVDRSIFGHICAQAGPRRLSHQAQQASHGLAFVPADTLSPRGGLRTATACRVVVNLLANTAKFTPYGAQVTLSTAVQGPGLDARSPTPGPALPPTSSPRLRKVLAGRNTRSTGGSGIVLGVVAELVKAHGARVEAASETGKEARFTVMLPRR